MHVFLRVLSLIFSRRVLVSLLLLLQLFLLIMLPITYSQRYEVISISLMVLSIVAVLYVISRKTRPAYKTLWVFLILAFPVFGGLLFLLFTFQSTTRRAKETLQKIVERTQPLALPLQDFLPLMEQQGHSESLRLGRYLQHSTQHPLYGDTVAEYLSPGEVKHATMLEELKKARHYIFLEYFILNRGVMWDSILEILKEKAAAGVDVRVMYDDMGNLFQLPLSFPRQLQQYGIKCVAFNRFRPVLSTLQNNRNHRKITVIDGKVAITGGINIGDEYINVVNRFGHWKDASVILRGEAAWSMAVMFLQLWSVVTRKEEDFRPFRPRRSQNFPPPGDGWVQPYSDSPIDDEHVGERVYLEIINGARDYLYINTPYLIVDDSMLGSLARAAKSGVDVRIVTPHHWDKLLVHFTTRSYYRELIEEGVKIYEYSDGFMHSKTFVADDKVATVGTVNMDFRSLYLHFECGAVLYNCRAVEQVKEDFLKTLESCQQVSWEDCAGNAFTRRVQDVLRLFAPLL